MNSPMFIDTDTASDDAVALMMAFAHRGDSIVGVGTVAGNCPVEQACINALFTARLCDADVPVVEEELTDVADAMTTVLERRVTYVPVPQWLAGRLMRYFIGAMRGLGKTDIYLICQRELIPMYAAHGFEHLGPSRSDHGGLSWHEMSLSL